MPARVPLEGRLAGEADWAEGLGAEEIADALRSAMREEYANASSEAMNDALEAVLGSLSPAEAYSLSRAFDRISRGAQNLVKDPTFIQVASTALPVVAGLAGGPAGMALGTIASKALLGGAAPPPAAEPTAPAPVSAAPLTPPPAITPLLAPPPAAPVPGPSAQPVSPPEIPPSAPGPAPSVAGGSAAAAQALVLTQDPVALRSLLAAALGPLGRRRVRDIPVAQVLALISQVVGQAAADADELMYSEQQADSSESVGAEALGSPAHSLYADLIRAENLEIAEAAEREGPG